MRVRKAFVAFLVVTLMGALTLMMFFTASPQHYPISMARSWLVSRLMGSNPACDAPWPDLELFLTTGATGGTANELFIWFLPAVSLFFPPKNLKLLIATDLENPAAPAFIARAKAEFNRTMPGVASVRGALVPAAFPTSSGWDKSQWMKFWADNYTNSTYVGYVDTDSFFVTRVTRSDLFHGDKPILRPIYGKPRKGWFGNWDKIPGNTFKYTGLKEPFNCMSFFPLIVKTAHLAVIRETIIQRMNGTYFDEVFAPIVKNSYYGFYSEYNMMCAVLWWNFRDDYYWIINETEPGWQEQAPPGQVANYSDAGITPEMLTRTRPHLTVHYAYYPGFEVAPTVNIVLKRAVCYALTENQAKPAACQAVKRYERVNEDEFIFEYDNFCNRTGAFKAHLERLARNELCPHKWNDALIAQLFGVLDYKSEPN